MKICFYAFAFLFFFACKNNNTNKKHASAGDKVYKLILNPSSAAKYIYDIVNDTRMTMEVDGKETTTENKSTVGLVYSAHKDSAGNVLLQMGYDNLKIYTKSADKEMELDAANASFSVNPVEKMLGILKAASFTATLNPKGEMKEITGYKELGEKLIAGFAPGDTYGREMAKRQWEGMIGQGFVKNNIDQLFKIFPDSLVRVGQQWKINAKQGGQFTLNTTSTYILEEINNNIATISLQGEVSSDEGASNLTGYTISSKLKGKQTGLYKTNMTTGMPESNEISFTIEGTIQTMGRDIPITIQTNLVMQARK